MTTSTTQAARPRWALPAHLVRPLLALDAIACGLLGIACLIVAAPLANVSGTRTVAIVVLGGVLAVYSLVTSRVYSRPTGRALHGLAGFNSVFALVCIGTALLAVSTAVGIAVFVALAVVGTVMSDLFLLAARATGERATAAK